MANDKGYAPILEHARDMGFAVQHLGYRRIELDASAKAASRSTADAAAKSLPKMVAAKKATAKKVTAKLVPAKKAMARKAVAPAPVAKKVAAALGNAKVPASPPSEAGPSSPLSRSAAMLKKITDNLRNMDQKRPVKLASLRRALKSILGAAASADSIEVALVELISAGVVAVNELGGVTYPGWSRK